MASHAPDEAPPPYADAHKFPQGKQTSYPNYPPPAGGSGNSTAGDVGNSGDTVPSAPPSAETTWNTGRPHSNATSHYGPAVGGVPMPGLTVPSENKPPRGPSPIPSPRLRRKDIEAPKAQPDVKAQELSAPPQHLGPAAPNTHAVAQPRPSQPVSGPVDGEPGVGIPVAHPVACPKQSAQVAGAPVQYTLLTNAGPGQPTGTWRMQPTTTGQHAPYPVQNMTHVPGQPQHQAVTVLASQAPLVSSNNNGNAPQGCFASYYKYIPAIPLLMAICVLIVNVVAPGIGTIFGGMMVLCCGHAVYKHQSICDPFCYSLLFGFLQLIMTPLVLIGWFYAVFWGILFIVVSCKCYRKPYGDEQKTTVTIVTTAPR